MNLLTQPSPSTSMHEDKMNMAGGLFSSIYSDLSVGYTSQGEMTKLSVCHMDMGGYSFYQLIIVNSPARSSREIIVGSSSGGDADFGRKGDQPMNEQPYGRLISDLVYELSLRDDVHVERIRLDDDEHMNDDVGWGMMK